MQTVKIRRTTIGTLKGTVIEGRKIARELGFPTANLRLDSFEGEFRLGVYGVTVQFHGKRFEGVMNAGIRPTFAEVKPAVHYEVHMFNFQQSIYGEKLEVNVEFFLRDEMKFPNVEQLKRQMEKDVQNVKKRFQLLNSVEREVHLTDFAFLKLCEEVYGINRGVYNTIDSLFYDKGITHIMKRRTAILSFLEYLTYQKDVKRTSRVKFGDGGLTTNLREFCQLHLGECS